MSVGRHTDSLEVVIGIPTRNNEATIERTFEQFQEQTRLPDQVIVVDASDDSTMERIERIANDLDFPVNIHPQSGRGQGVGAARQDIYERFDGDVLVCLHTNHAVESDWLETHARFHRNNPEIGILSNSNRVGFDEEVTDPKRSEFFGQSNCSLKRSALNLVDGWDPWMGRGEDWDLRIRLWSAGVRSWAKHSINASRIERDVAADAVARIRKTITASPSSVTFLRKYGTWYVSFHPLHPLGDFLSMLSLLLLLLAPAGAAVAPVSLTVLLGIPLLLSLAYVYYKGPRKLDGFTVLPRHFVSIPIFLCLGLSAVYNFRRLGGREDWNYGGFER